MKGHQQMTRSPSAPYDRLPMPIPADDPPPRPPLIAGPEDHARWERFIKGVIKKEKLANKGVEFDDLMGVGWLALVECHDRHDGRPGFNTYAWTHIKGAMVNAIAKEAKRPRTTRLGAAFDRDGREVEPITEVRQREILGELSGKVRKFARLCMAGVSSRGAARRLFPDDEAAAEAFRKRAKRLLKRILEKYR
jgi:hypothetical protein